ncbi:MAG: ferredoxin [Acidobacteria bacterium]|nr:ferredoxin [Acidobacteriota bacterium]
MIIQDVEGMHREYLLETARAMAVAARTAPKGRGSDNLVIRIVTDDDVTPIVATMREIGRSSGQAFFERDAANVERAGIVVLLGARIEPLGLKVCGMCGFADCDEKRLHPTVPCVFNTGDLGIALGSAVAVAADRRVDNRIMYTVGQAVKKLGWLGDEVSVIYGIPLSATSKSPFFDRPAAQ